MFARYKYEKKLTDVKTGDGNLKKKIVESLLTGAIELDRGASHLTPVESAGCLYIVRKEVGY